MLITGSRSGKAGPPDSARSARCAAALLITGAHAIIYSTDAEADRAFLRDVIGLPNVDVGGGWLIFTLPPSEVAVHPAAPPANPKPNHELFFLVADIEVFQAEMAARGVPCTEIDEQPWGRLVHVTLPGASRFGVYEPHHDRPPSA